MTQEELFEELGPTAYEIIDMQIEEANTPDEEADNEEC